MAKGIFTPIPTKCFLPLTRHRKQSFRCYPFLPSPVYGRGAGGEGDPTTGDSTTAYDQSTPGQVLWPLTDHLGTVRDLAVHDAETDTTAVANHIVYDAYGRVTSETNAAVDCLFAFTGRALDPATGLQNNWNRWYDANVGRWISEDPIGFDGRDTNLGRYVGNSPTNRTDSTGLDGNNPMAPEWAEFCIQWASTPQNSVHLKWKKTVYEVQTIKVQSGTFRIRGVLSKDKNYVDVRYPFHKPHLGACDNLKSGMITELQETCHECEEGSQGPAKGDDVEGVGASTGAKRRDGSGVLSAKTA